MYMYIYIMGYFLLPKEDNLSKMDKMIHPDVPVNNFRGFHYCALQCFLLTGIYMYIHVHTCIHGVLRIPKACKQEPNLPGILWESEPSVRTVLQLH